MAKKKKNKNNISISNIAIKKVERKKTVKQYPKCENQYNIKVPNDTCSVISKFGLEKIDNFHLKLNRYAQFDEGLDRFAFDESIEEFDFSDYKDILQIDKEIIEKLNLNLYECSLKVDYRLKIGAEQSIYETSLRLHHIYGIPYIPASAIKGVVRSYIIIEKFDSKEEEALKDSEFIDIFGSQEQEGRVIFFDAFPITKPTIKVDIMNPHYGHYYNEGKAPTDDKNPIPINFLTVENTEFQFFIASKENLESFKIKDKSIEKWFKEALQNHGIGGKSAVGYGYLEEVKK